MGRRKGQHNDKPGIWLTAEAVKPATLSRYMCEIGPRYCPLCFSKCAFGERYLALRRAGLVPALKIEPLRRYYKSAGRKHTAAEAAASG